MYVEEENMKKKIIMLIALCVLLSGCGSKIPKLSNGEEAVVTMKNNDISVDALYNEMKDDYALTALVNMIDRQILEDKYEDKIEDGKNATENMYQQLQATYGDQTEDLINQYYGSVEAYKESYYLNYMRNLAITDYAKDQIKDKEIKKYYDEKIKPDIKVSHILITADVKDGMSEEEKTAKENEAKSKVEAIIKELKSTSKDEVEAKFSELAAAQSKDDSTKNNGGSLGYINTDTLSSQYDELVKAAYKLKDGEYSTTVITTELGYHVILRTDTKEKAKLEDVKDTILDALAETYISENPVCNVTALQELRKDYDVDFVDSDLKTKYASYIQNQIAAYQQQAKNQQ